MATVPIVTEVTKAQLDALVAANGLNEGLQYKVTDKGWLLLATSANSTDLLTPSNPFIIIVENDDSLIIPSYINVKDFIAVKTVNYDISSDTGEPVNIKALDENSIPIPNWAVKQINFITSGLLNDIENISILCDGNQVLESGVLSNEANNVIFIPGWFQIGSGYSFTLNGDNNNGTLILKIYYTLIT